MGLPMFDITNLLVSNAWAAEVAAPAVEAAANAGGQDSGSFFMRFLPLLLILGVFYVLIIRPQQKKVEAAEKLVSALKKGDKVITNSGIVGTITKIDGEHYAVVEIAKGVEVKMVKSTISGLVDENVPANQNK